MLKLQLKDQQQSPLWVVEKLYTIGSAPDNNLVLHGAGVAPLHARLITTANKVFLKDNKSASGCYVNDQRVTQKEILPGDLIRLGGVELEVLGAEADSTDTGTGTDEWRLVADGSWLSGQSYNLPKQGAASIGRASECDIVIPGSHLSRRHAELTVQGSSLRIKDLGSVNGTYLNEQPITTALAHSGDRLRLDLYSFRIVGPESRANKPHKRHPSLGNIKPLERTKPPSQSPRRWKTRPTSPGNRQEPTTKERRQELWLWVVLVAAATLLIGGIYWV